MDYCIKCSQPLFHGTIPHRCIADIPCPSCAALREQLQLTIIDQANTEAEGNSLRARIEDVEALTDKLFANFYPATLSRCHVVAEYLSKWLKEGK